MYRPIRLNADGRAHHGRARPHRDPNGISMFSGNSTNTNKAVKTLKLNSMHAIAPWTRYNWKTYYRNSYEAFLLFLDRFIDAAMVQGFSPYHSSTIMDDDIKVADDAIEEEWAIPEGSKYYIFPRTLYVCLKGDDAPFKNLPTELHSICATFLFVSFWNCRLSHSIHSSVATLLSGEGSKQPHIINLHQEQIGQLCQTDKAMAWSDNKNCWCLIRYRHFQNGDWAFSHVVWTRTLGPTGGFFLHGITLFVGGVPMQVPNNMDSLHDALQTGIDKTGYFPNLQELQTSKFSGYVLTTDEIAAYFGDMIEEKVDQLKQETGEQLSYEEEHKVRRTIANKLGISILYKPKHPSIFSTTWEQFHAFLQNVCRFITLLCTLTYVYWQWSQARITVIVKSIGMCVLFAFG